MIAAQWIAFIEGYTSRTDVDDREIAYLPLFAVLRTLNILTIVLKNENVFGRQHRLTALKDAHAKSCHFLNFTCTRTSLRNRAVDDSEPDVHACEAKAVAQ
ncbi:hypothetical protein [Robbsia sp. KACC 23696]|uniref:hypothetical protein n=1 Tax=Robbsia sp. KACC 23696 TaxID=3149231 RepID=UPI00325A81E5